MVQYGISDMRKGDLGGSGVSNVARTWVWYGRNSDTDAAGTRPCPPGTFRAAPGAANVTDCAPCGPGTYCDAGASANATCPQDSYCPTPAEKVACAAGRVCSAGATGPGPCLGGWYCATGGTAWQELATVSGGDLADSAYWDARCGDGDVTTDTLLRVVMGEVHDYFKPTSDMTLCAFLKSSTSHSWSATEDGAFVVPEYYFTHFGGSSVNWPTVTDGRTRPKRIRIHFERPHSSNLLRHT